MLTIAGIGRELMRLIVCVALLTAGCATEPTTRVVTKTRHCTTTVAPMSKNEFCSAKKNCPVIETCGEAYFRYTSCGHLWLDGGAAVPRDGQPNGIPCEKMCGKDALASAGRIRSELPFSLRRPSKPAPAAAETGVAPQPA